LLNCLLPEKRNDTMHLVTKSQLIERIQGLSDDELEHVGPYLEADLEVLAPDQDLVAEIERGQASARTEPLLDNRTALEQAAARLRPRRG
jgi:hypothetical protein